MGSAFIKRHRESSIADAAGLRSVARNQALQDTHWPCLGKQTVLQGLVRPRSLGKQVPAQFALHPAEKNSSYSSTDIGIAATAGASTPGCASDASASASASAAAPSAPASASACELPSVHPSASTAPAPEIAASRGGSRAAPAGGTRTRLARAAHPALAASAAHTAAAAYTDAAA
eukprot:913850-Pleurochrysis_carterae.AAC.4